MNKSSLDLLKPGFEGEVFDCPGGCRVSEGERLWSGRVEEIQVQWSRVGPHEKVKVSLRGPSGKFVEFIMGDNIVIVPF